MVTLKDYRELREKVFTVVDPSEIPKGLRFYKLFNEKEKHHNLRYATGLIVDPVPFNPDGECCAGGMYFFDQFQLPDYDRYVSFSPRFMREVFLESTSKVYLEGGKYKTDRFTLGEKSVCCDERKFFYRYIDWENGDECEIAFSTNKHLLSLIPKEYKTRELCEQILHFKEGNIGTARICIGNVPKGIFTEEEYIHLIKKDADVALFIPRDILTYKMCLEAVSRSFELLYVPKKFRTEELCDLAIEKCNNAYRIAESVPQHMLTYDKYLTLVKKGMYPGKIPKDMRTEEMYVEAIRFGTIQYISLIPSDMLTSGICDALVRKGASLGCIPTCFMTREMCEYAVNRFSCEIEYVPKEFITKNTMMEVVAGNYILVKYAPEEILDEEICEAMFTKDRRPLMVLRYVPDRFKDAMIKKFCDV